MYDMGSTSGTLIFNQGLRNGPEVMTSVRQVHSLLIRGLFVLWGGWGERKRERELCGGESHLPAIFSLPLPRSALTCDPKLKM